MADTDKTPGAAFTEYLIDAADSTSYVLEELLVELDGAESLERLVDDAVAEYKNWLESSIEYIKENGI